MLIPLYKKYYLLGLFSLLVVSGCLFQYVQIQSLLGNNSPQVEVLSRGHSGEVLPTHLTFSVTAKPESYRQWQDITVKNNTDKTQSYSLSWSKLADHNNLPFMFWTFPEVVSVPANTSVVFALIMSSTTNHPKLSQMIDQTQQVKMVLMLTERNASQVQHLIPVELHFSNEQHSS